MWLLPIVMFMKKLKPSFFFIILFRQPKLHEIQFPWTLWSPNWTKLGWFCPGRSKTHSLWVDSQGVCHLSQGLDFFPVTYVYSSSVSGTLLFQLFTNVSISICEQRVKNHYFFNPAYSRSSINSCYFWFSWIWRLVYKRLSTKKERKEQLDFCKLWKGNSTIFTS